MSFLAGLLRREIPTPTASAGSTTPDAAVVPRFASRFEDRGAPRWPGTVGHPATGISAMDAGADIRTGAGHSELPGSPITAGPMATGPMAGPSAAVRQPKPGNGQLVPATPAPYFSSPLAPAGSLPSFPQAGRENQPRTGTGPSARQAAGAPGSLRGAQQQVQPARLTDLQPAAAHQGGPDPAETGQPARPSGVVRGEATAARSGRATPQHFPDVLLPPSAPSSVRPRLEPLPRRETARAPEQHIHVHIGRIEVKAVAAPVQRPAAVPECTGLMSLDEYLEGRP